MVRDEVTFTCRGRTYQPRFVGQADMECGGISFGINGDRSYTKPSCGTNYPAGDFTSIGYKNLVKHRSTSNPAWFAFFKIGGQTFTTLF